MVKVGPIRMEILFVHIIRNPGVQDSHSRIDGEGNSNKEQGHLKTLALVKKI